MHRIRGFRIKHKLVRVIKRGLHRRPRITSRAVSKLRGMARSLKESAKGLCSFRKPNSGYIRLGEEVKNSVPKGHLAVYVGEKKDDAHRVLVPVIYFNHPLFGELLREAEKVYGFNYHGGIHVPCRISEFQHLQTKINAAAAAGGGGGGGGGGVSGGCCGGDGFRPRRSWRLTL